MQISQLWKRWWTGDAIANGALSECIGSLANQIPFTRMDAAANVAITGATGSGKTTTAYFDQLAMHCAAGNGAAIFIPKANDGESVMALLKSCGALDRVTRVRPGSGICLNPLEWICQRSNMGGSVDFQIVRLLMQLVEVLERGKGQGGRDDDQYFRGQTERTLFFGSACCRLAYGTVTVIELLKFITSLPSTAEDLSSEHFLNGFAHLTLLAAVDRAATDYDRLVMNDAIDWMRGEFAPLADKPKSCITTTATALLHRLVYGVARELVAGRSTVNFESILDGAIFVIDVSPKEFFDEAILVSTAIKQFCQMVVEADGGRRGRQVLLAIDEYPLYAVAADAGVMATSRSSGLCWVIAFQTLPGLYAAFGGTEYAKNLVDGLVANTNTIIATQSSCNVSNEWFCQRVGRQRRYFINTSNTAQAYLDFKPWNPGPPQTQVSLNEQYDFILQPLRLTQFRRGGASCNFQVDAAVTMAGRSIGPSGEPFVILTFSQWRL